MDYDASDIFKYKKTDSNTLGGEGKMLFWTMQFHMEYYLEINSILKHEELHPQGSKADHIIGADQFLKKILNCTRRTKKIRIIFLSAFFVFLLKI